jgi:hypothetical protein
MDGGVDKHPGNGKSTGSGSKRKDQICTATESRGDFGWRGGVDGLLGGVAFRDYLLQAMTSAQ